MRSSRKTSALLLLLWCHVAFLALGYLTKPTEVAVLPRRGKSGTYFIIKPDACYCCVLFDASLTGSYIAAVDVFVFAADAVSVETYQLMRVVRQYCDVPACLRLSALTADRCRLYSLHSNTGRLKSPQFGFTPPHRLARTRIASSLSAARRLLQGALVSSEISVFHRYVDSVCPLF